jgi:hypothetical protein
VREVGADGSASAPSGLTATVLDRRRTSFHLAWTAPAAANGQAVSGYLVRVARVPITEANFDDLSVTQDSPYTRTPAAPGSPDGADVTSLTIEIGYYFAVAAFDAGNARGPIAATNVAMKASFNATPLTGTNGATEQFGFQFEAGDADGNEISDLLVGSFTGKRAYLYLGSGATAPTAASVTFNGDATTTASFGRGVAFIGDIDADGRGDIAVSDRGTSAHIYIYKGRATWPVTLSNTDANYVITVDASYDGSIFGSSMARLGDFNGDGVDDFALGASLFGGTAQLGRVVVILGRTGFTSMALPDATNSIVIEGDPAVASSQFGYRVVGLGHLYSVSAGTTLVASAPGNVAIATGNEGRIYAFHGRNGVAGAIPIASADHVAVGPALNTRIGIALANMGPMVNALPSIGSGNPVERVTTPSGNTYVFAGTAAGGPFASKIVAYQAGAGLSGIAVIGGGVSGLDQAFSLVGDATPDLVVISQAAAAFNIIDGDALASLASPIDATTKSTTGVAFPADWGSTGEAQGCLIPDLNGDGYADFAIGNASGSVPGKVLVFW